jgi:hypothetical protein
MDKIKVLVSILIVACLIPVVASVASAGPSKYPGCDPPLVLHVKQPTETFGRVATLYGSQLRGLKGTMQVAYGHRLLCWYSPGCPLNTTGVVFESTDSFVRFRVPGSLFDELRSWGEVKGEYPATVHVVRYGQCRELHDFAYYSNVVPVMVTVA